MSWEKSELADRRSKECTNNNDFMDSLFKGNVAISHFHK